MKSTQRFFALVLCLVMCLAFFPASASAAGIMASGNAGTNAEFVLYTDGRLVISGSGAVDAMNQWSFSSWGGYTSANDAIRQTRSEVKSLYIEEGIRRLSASAFQECPKLALVELPISLSDAGSNPAIGDSAFRDCASLSSIYIPNNVQTIGASAFRGCSSLSEVYLSDGLQQIGSRAFFDCVSLKAITVPANVQQIGSQFCRIGILLNKFDPFPCIFCCLFFCIQFQADSFDLFIDLFLLRLIFLCKHIEVVFIDPVC